MKTVLKISLMLNVGLLAGLTFIYLGAMQRKESPTPAPPLSAVKTTPVPSAGVLTSTPQNPTRVESASFNWKQLYTKDYHGYVKNLRAIGCPEETVRAIVTADVYAVFAFRAGEIEKQLSNLNNSSWTNQFTAVKEEAALKDELQNMPDAEAAEIADLLGLKPAPVQVAATAQPSRRTPQAQRTMPVSQPLVLQDIDLSALNLTEEQKQAIANIRQDFLQQIGGANQDPNDPAYLARWQQAQPAADDLLKAYLGGDGYADYVVLATQKTLAEQNRGQQ